MIHIFTDWYISENILWPWPLSDNVLWPWPLSDNVLWPLSDKVPWPLSDYILWPWPVNDLERSIGIASVDSITSYDYSVVV